MKKAGEKGLYQGPGSGGTCSTIPGIEFALPSARLRRDSVEDMERMVGFVVGEQDGTEELCDEDMTDESEGIEMEVFV